MSSTVAFIGLGHMGMPMAARVAGNPELEVNAFDLSTQALADASSFARPATDLADAVRGAELICSMVPADSHLRTVAEELSRTACAGQIFVDFSTVSPGAIEEARRLLAPAGVHVVGASCMKSVAAAKAGELSLYVGGSPEDLAALEPVFKRVATDRRELATIAAAKTMKIINNLLTATMGYCLLDGLVLAAALGCKPGDGAAALREAAADSWVLQQHVVRHAIAEDLGPGIFSASYMAKDVELAVDLASSVRRSAFFAALTLSGYRGMSRLGLGDAYHPAVVRWIERISGTARFTETPGRRPAQELADLWPGLRRVQQLVVDEALAVAEAAGTPARAAAELLQSGSARSDALADYLSDGFERRDALPDLLTLRRFAASAQAPALSIEIAIQLASAA